MIKMRSECAIQIQKEVYLCFIVYTKAFDKVLRRNVEKIRGKHYLYVKGIQAIRNFY